MSTPRSPRRRLAAAALAAGASLAALAAAGPAAAQGTGVTLYGRVDLNVTKFSGGPWEMTQTSTSRIGLRGTEPLGSGWAAIFQFESRINPDTGTTEAAFWGRESWVGMRGPLGTLRLGRTLTPAQRIASNYDPHGTDGIGSFGSGGLLISTSPLARFDDGVYFETPKLAGFSVFAGVQLDDKINTADDRFTSIRLRYEAGPLDLSLGHADLSPGNRVASVGGAYAFGGVKPMFQFHTGRRNGGERSTWLVGVVARLGSGELRAATSRNDDRSSADIDRTLTAVGYDHPISKRTLVYGTVARDRTSGAKASNGFELGIRHGF
jgi:predicted porin